MRVIQYLFKISLLPLFVALAGQAYAEKPDSPTEVKGATTIDAAKAKTLFDDEVPFIDVRKQADYDAGRIPDAYHLNIKKGNYNEEALAKIVKSKDDPFVVYCNGAKCQRSSKAAMKAVKWGYKNVYYFRLGFPDWKAKGNPVE